MSDLPKRAASPPARFTIDTIAGLASRQIEWLADEELVEVIRAVDYPFAGKERLEYFDRDTLERIVFLVRRWCQNKLAQPPAEQTPVEVPVATVPFRRAVG